MTLKVLVADDSDAIHKAIKLAFTPYAVEITAAYTFAEALQASKAQRPAIIIADASLAGVTGAEDFCQLRQLAGQVPLLLLQGSYEALDRPTFEGLNLRFFLKKPFKAQDLITLVVEMTRSPLSVGLAPSEDKPSLSPIGGGMPYGNLASPLLEPARRLGGEAETLPLSREELRKLIIAVSEEAIAKHVNQAVEKFCLTHFKSLAQSVIRKELQQLADDKTSLG